MGDLSQNFSRREFACHHCGQTVIDPDLVEALQELRDLANKPVTVRSGYRCPAHNDDVKGASDSQHLKGTAADIVIGGLSYLEMYELALKIPRFRNGGIGLYPEKNFIHVDVRDNQARWAFMKGKYVSIDEALA